MSNGGTKSSEILNIAEVRMYLSDVGAVAPTDCRTKPGSDWYDVGHTTEDGLSFSTTPNFEEFKSAQSRGRVVKRVQTADDATVAAVLTQWNGRNLKAAFGGGKIEQLSAPVKDANGKITKAGLYRFTAAKLGERTELAVILDVMEGTKIYRFVFPRCFQTEGVQIDLNIGATANLPLSLSVLANDDGDAFYVLIEDVTESFKADAA